MKRLAIAIARDRANWIDRGAIIRYSSQGLAILHQPSPVDVLAPGLKTLENYASAIARIHAQETILPLRFGSLHDSEADLDGWLKVHSQEWQTALDEVEDCDEIGIRVLLEPSEARPRTSSQVRSDRPGTAYLEALKARHHHLEASLEQAQQVIDRLQTALEGTFRRSLIEEPQAGRERLLSLTYLVPRSTVDRFLKAIEPLHRQVAGKLLLTGPWPPYSFVGDPSPGLIVNAF